MEEDRNPRTGRTREELRAQEPQEPQDREASTGTSGKAAARRRVLEPQEMQVARAVYHRYSK